MPVPFGFSVGDFLACANVLKDVGLALREHGGASSEYQQTLHELESINAVLEELQSIKSIGQQPTIVNAIRGQAQATQYAVSRFLGKISTLDPALGSSAPKGFHRGAISKAKWAACVAKEVHRLWETIQAQSMSLRLLLSMHATDRVNSIAETAHETKDLISVASANSFALLQAVDNNVGAMASSMKNDVQFSRDKVLLRIGEIGKQVAAVEHAMQNQIQVQTEVMANEITSRLRDLHVGIQNAFSTGLAQNKDLLTGLHQWVATSDQVDRLSQQVHDLSVQAKTDASHKQVKADAGQVDELKRIFQASPLFILGHRPDSSKLRPDLAPPSPTIIPGAESGRLLLCDILRDLFIVLSSDLAEVFTRTFVMLIRHLHSLIYVWPQLLFLWRVMRRLPPTISLVLHDNITFEDVLGRIHSLQYQQFKHWRVFKENLEQSFKGLPGSRKVRTGQFRLANATIPDRVYDKSNWSQKLQPGTSLVMSIIIDALSHGSQQCPRCETRVSGTVRRRYFCAECSLHWEVSEANEKSHPGSPYKSLEGIRRKQRRQGKQNLADLAHEMTVEVTNEAPEEWLLRHTAFTGPEALSRHIRPEKQIDLANLRHLETRRKRRRRVPNDLMSFKRIHVREPMAILDNMLGMTQDAPAAPECEARGRKVEVVWVADDKDPRRTYPQVVEKTGA